MHTKFETITNDGYSIVDNLSGELHEFKQVKKVSYDDFVLLFLSSIPEIYKLRGSEIKVLMACLKYSTFNPKGSAEGNFVYNDLDFKDSIRKDGLNLPDTTIDSYISRLTSKGFLIRRCKGKYLLNPRYFFKGTHSDAAKMSLTIEVEPQLPKK